MRACAMRFTWAEPSSRLRPSWWDTVNQDTATHSSITTVARVATTSPRLTSRWVRRIRYRWATTRPASKARISGTVSHGKDEPSLRSRSSWAVSDRYSSDAAGSSSSRMRAEASRR